MTTLDLRICTRPMSVNKKIRSNFSVDRIARKRDG